MTGREAVTGAANAALQPTRKGFQMSDAPSNSDDAKGRVKEAAGNLTGDKDLKREGKVDQAGGKAKSGVEKVTDKVKDALRRD